jgi:hypothetical protein
MLNPLCVTDTIKRKVNGSDASRFAAMIGFFGPRVWGKFPIGLTQVPSWLIPSTDTLPGAIWLINSIICKSRVLQKDTPQADPRFDVY